MIAPNHMPRVAYGYLSVVGGTGLVLGWRQDLVAALDLGRAWACSTAQLVRVPRSQIAVYSRSEALLTDSALVVRPVRSPLVDYEGMVISQSLPPAPWPGRWVVELIQGSAKRYLIGWSGSPRREVRIGREVEVRGNSAMWPECPADAECRVVGAVQVEAGAAGAHEAGHRAALLCLSFLVMES